MWINDEFFYPALIEVPVAFRRLIQQDDGNVYRFRDLNFVMQFAIISCRLYRRTEH